MERDPTDPPPRVSGFGAWPLRTRAWLEFTVSFASLAALGLTIGWLLLGPFGGTGLIQLDTRLTIWFAEQRTATLNTITSYTTQVSGTLEVIGILIITSALFAWLWRRWRETVFLPLALGLESSVFLAVSTILGRARPPVEHLDPAPPTASFPSGHVGASVALYVGLAIVVFWNTDRPIWRFGAVMMAVAAPVVVALSRIYRGMHYPSDVLGGALLGGASLFLACGIVRRATSRRDS